VASCVGPFAEADARYRATLSRSMEDPKGSAGTAGKSTAREPARECWAFGWSEQSRPSNVVPTRTAPRAVSKRDVVRLFIPTRGMTSVRVSPRRDVSSWRQVRERRARTAVPRSCGSALTERGGSQEPAGRGRSPRRAASSGVAHQR
jgi:hypothetical protein